jgi:PPP family 3-phenylpropionic acid transporter
LARPAARGSLSGVSPAARFALIFAAQFFAFGVLLPFLPAVLVARGLGPEEVAVLLAVGSAVRLVSGPLGGRLADALGDPRAVLAAAAALAALAAGGFLLASGFGLLLLVLVLQSAAVAPVVPLSDAVAVVASRTQPGFDYARVRAAGSIAFIIAAVGGGQAVALGGPDAAIWLVMAGLAATALAALALPRGPAPSRAAPRGLAGFLAPLGIPAMRRLILVSALIQGSHAMYYAFGTLHWQAAGLGAGLIGGLWAAGVMAEVALFWWGRGVVARLGPVGLSVAAGLAGVLRWGITALTVDPWLLFPAQLLHGATFGMQHLAAMAVLGRIVPPAQAGTAQALHAALGLGLWMGVFTLACGPLYAAVGGAGFWAMAVLCAAAVPASLWLGSALRRP